MGRWFGALLGIIALIAVTAGVIDTRNADESANITAWSKLESAYRERLALLDTYLQIANKRFGNSEELQVLTSCFRAAQAAHVDDPSNTAEMATYHELQDTLTGALAKLVISRDIYPPLLADTAFRSLHNRLDETEARISRSVEEYNRTLHEQNLDRHRLVTRVSAAMKGRTTSAPDVRQRDRVTIVTSTARTGADNPGSLPIPPVTVASN